MLFSDELFVLSAKRGQAQGSQARKNAWRKVHEIMQPM